MCCLLDDLITYVFFFLFWTCRGCVDEAHGQAVDGTARVLV